MKRSKKVRYYSTLDWISRKNRHWKENLINFLENCKTNGQKVYGLGASTKGNVLLQCAI